MAGEERARYSLSRRIILTTLLIFLASFWGLSYYASRMLRVDMERLLADQQSSIVSYVADELDGQLQARVLALETVARSIDQSVLDHPATLQQRLEDRPILQDMFNSGVLAVSVDGTAVADVPAIAGRRGTNYASNAATHTALTEGRSIIGRPLVGRVLQQPLFNINVPIRDGHGQVIGALFGVINLAKPNFLDRIGQHRYGKRGGYLVIDLQNNLIVTATDQKRAAQPLPDPGKNATLDKRRQGFLGSEVTVNSLGVEVLSSASRIPVAGWLVVATLPTEEAFAPIRDMQRRILFASVLLTLIAGAISWWLLRRQLAPLHAAVDCLAEMSGASTAPQPLPIVKEDEIGQLVGGFNRLLATLGEREAQLKIERDFFKAVLQQSSDGLFLFDPVDLRIVEVNPRLCSMLGYERDELLALKLSNLLDEAQENTAESVTQAAQDKLPVVRELNFRKKDGAAVAVEVNAGLVEAAERELVMVNVRDLTERKLAEAELRDLNRNFVSFLENTTDFIYFKDQLSRFLFCSQALARITGHTSWRDLIGKHDLEVFPNDTAKIYVEEELPIFRDGTPLLDKIDPFYDESGNVGWVNTNKWPLFDDAGENVVGIFGISRDVTALMIAEEARMRAQLKEAQLLHRIESLMKHANDCIMMLDSTTRILEVSDGCIDTYGYRRDELLDMRSIDLRAPQARVDLVDFMQMLEQKGWVSYKTWHCRKDGSSFPIEVGAAMIDDGDERFIQIIIRDISERVHERSKMELELAAYAKRLELASRRLLVVQEEAKRRFSGELHDRTSPNLAAIRINLAIIARLPPAQSKERIERIEDTQALIDDTASSLREICAELRPAVLDYAGLAAALEAYAQQFAARTGIAIRVDCANGQQRLAPALESLLFRICQEALTNCLKHANAKAIAVALRSDAQPITLTIVDDGDGFDPGRLGQDGQVDGLGLLNMREMVEFSGGCLAIESRPGQGTRIAVLI